MPKSKLDALIAQIKTRHAELRVGSARYDSFMAHLQSLGSWEQEAMNYPDETPDFPENIYLAYAVCHTDCGVKQVIVDGSTQECQRCGRLMFRIATKKYTALPD
ncbi:hypothetical protein [Methylogaea oryzae]|uniref:Uncharacterized protein n=1 Tax=Methylogaea oryzae TaxID=1295382 RepID=A0A8D4VP55_9GAMM|nr:hypothetical protein [Methylogaea oryzae]BBL71813.1 hypothetical protein MoryE10_24190 [Methylogaea oryzae]